MTRIFNHYLASTLLVLALSPVGSFAQNPGDSKVVATVPAPGYPEGIAIRGNRLYVSGPATFGLPLGSAYGVLEWDSALLGELVLAESSKNVRTLRGG